MTFCASRAIIATKHKKHQRKAYGDSALSISKFKRWFADKCLGRPKDIVVIPDEVNGMMLLDRRLKLQKVAKTIDISTERVYDILNVIFMPRDHKRCFSLSLNNKRNRVTISKAYLIMFRRKSSYFLSRYITVTEKPHYQPPN